MPDITNKLNPSIIALMAPGQELSDPENPGLRVRCGAKGVKVFFYRYKADSGALRQIKLGEFPPAGAMTLAGARKALAEAKTARHKGVDLQGEKQAAKTKAKGERVQKKVKGYTVGRMLEDYLAGHVVPVRNDKGAAEVTRFLSSADLNAIRKRPAVEVTRNEAFNLITKIRGRGVTVLAGQIKTELKAAYEFAMNAGVIDMAGNPFAFTLKGLVAKKRDRVLLNHELIALVPWIKQHYSETVADALMLTLYCGVRSGEVCEIEAREIEDSAEGMVWTIPASKSKNKHSFRVMLPRQAAEIVRKRMAMHPKSWLFPGRDPSKPIAQKVLGVEVWAHSPRTKVAKHRNIAKCPVVDWAPHDLRRTCRTGLSRLGCPVEVGEAILNHVKGGVRGNYDLYKYDIEKREWLQRWADQVTSLLTADNVVPIAQARAG